MIRGWWNPPGVNNVGYLVAKGVTGGGTVNVGPSLSIGGGGGGDGGGPPLISSHGDFNTNWIGVALLLKRPAPMATQGRSPAMVSTHRPVTTKVQQGVHRQNTCGYSSSATGQTVRVIT